MNILYFVHGFPPSIEVASINAFKIVEHLIKFGHKVLVLTPGIFSKTSLKSNLNEISNLNIEYSSKLMKIPLNLIFSHFENMVKFLIKLKHQFKPDLILSQYHAYHYASVVAGYVSKILKVPHLIRSHDIFFPTKTFSLPLRVFHSIYYPLIYRSILNCNIFYVTTTEMKRHFLKFKELQNVNFKVHHNGIDTDLFFPFNNQDELKEKYGCENIILFVGQISRDYDLQHITKVLPRILKTHKDTHFLIIGSGPHEKNFLNFLLKNQLTKQVHYLGLKPHYKIPYFINNSTIGIGRITHEKIWRYMIPVKCLEYMACKKPFISAPCSADLVKNNDVGLILDRKFTEKDVFNAFVSLIEDKALREKLGKNGYEKIKKKFRWDKIMANFNNDLLQITRDL